MGLEIIMLQLNSAQRGEAVKFLLMFGMGWSTMSRYTIISEFPATIWSGPAMRKLLFYEYWAHDPIGNPYARFKLRPEVLEALKDDG